MEVDTGEFKKLEAEHIKHVPGYISPMRFWGALGLSIPVICSALFSIVVWAGDQRYEQKGEVRYQILAIEITKLQTKMDSCKMHPEIKNCWKDYEQSQLNEYKRQLRNIERLRTK